MIFSHIGYVVLDIPSELEKWLKSGYKIEKPIIYDKFQNVNFCLLTHENELTIELISPGSAGPHPLTSRIRRGGGLDHVCYQVKDFDSIISKERLNGSLFILKRTFSPLFGCDVIFFLRKSGLLVEYLESDN